jgi:hypothetical protein
MRHDEWCMVLVHGAGACACAWCMVHGAWCMVHGAWCMVHGAWCKWRRGKSMQQANEILLILYMRVIKLHNLLLQQEPRMQKLQDGV